MPVFLVLLLISQIFCKEHFILYGERLKLLGRKPQRVLLVQCGCVMFLAVHVDCVHTKVRSLEPLGAYRTPYHEP